MTQTKGQIPTDPIKLCEWLGELQFTPAQVAAVLEVDALDERQQKAYLKGTLLGSAKVRSALMRSAINNSGAGQKEYLALVNAREADARRLARDQASKDKDTHPRGGESEPKI